ncbi:hypothetical protein [Phaffia rhodozyma]|uniref:BZIP domain-containing protein n=1 Tax=Phaffia rhodozyma TaxID=264483 RepID=A0A0F7STH5_PHARH|nr:hypothetical protein [Phaffia rhodozyma]
MPASKRGIDKANLSSDEILANQRERNRKKQAALRARRAQKLLDLEQEIARLGGNHHPSATNGTGAHFGSSLVGSQLMDGSSQGSVHLDGQREIRKLSVVIGRLVGKLKEFGVDDEEIRSMTEDGLEEELGEQGIVENLMQAEDIERDGTEKSEREAQEAQYADYIRLSGGDKTSSLSSGQTVPYPTNWPSPPRVDPNGHSDPPASTTSSGDPLGPYPVSQPSSGTSVAGGTNMIGIDGLLTDSSSNGIQARKPSSDNLIGNPSPNTPPGSAFPFAFLFSGPGPAGSILPQHELQQQQSFIRSLSTDGGLSSEMISREPGQDMPVEGEGESTGEGIGAGVEQAEGEEVRDETQGAGGEADGVSTNEGFLVEGQMPSPESGHMPPPESVDVEPTYDHPE